MRVLKRQSLRQFNVNSDSGDGLTILRTFPKRFDDLRKRFPDVLTVARTLSRAFFRRISALIVLRTLLARVFPNCTNTYSRNKSDMFKVRMLKLKTEIVTYLAKLCGVFNKRIKGIKIKYNRRYCNDWHKYHMLDVMYSKDSVKNGGNVDGAKPCVLYMHGGGWCAYDKRVFRSTCKRLCACGTVVFNCNFRLAPRFSVEDMQQDVYAIMDYISANASLYGGDPEKIILAGDSAGAHLLSLFLNKALLNKEKVAEKVIGCAFFYGVYNLETALGTGFKHLDTYMSSIVPATTADYYGRLREISPVNYVSGDIPPTLICSGEIDKLNETQSQQYAQILSDLGVKVTSLIFPKDDTSAKHKFITFDTCAAAKRSFEAFAAFVKTL